MRYIGYRTVYRVAEVDYTLKAMCVCVCVYREVYRKSGKERNVLNKENKRTNKTKLHTHASNREIG